MPGPVLEQIAFVNLAQTYDRLRTAFSALFKEHGITEPQYNVLRILRGAGGGLPCSQIGDRMITRVPDVTRLLDRLEAHGLIARNRDGEDRRIVLTSITPDGLKLLTGLDRPVMELHRRTLGHMSERDLEQLNRLLMKARNGR
ncbi:MAG: MarR family transcriptional regulator [Bacteroidetes bacterium]|nr:MarR family transcriptional regulator [Bacteroidota bacterium]